jgi:uncharacterized protein YjbI with pentapeptide repeats
MDRVRALGHRPRGWWLSQNKTTRAIVAGLLGGAVVSIVLEQVFLSHSLNGLCLNLATELIGAVATFILINQIVGGGEEKERLIAQLGSVVNEEAIRAVEELRRHGWLRDGSLQGAPLEDANLQGAGLYHANLQGAHLWRANLQGVHLNWANLQEAELNFANLQGVHLGAANLQGARLTSANLQRARLWKANLQGAELAEANLQGASLVDNKVDENTVLPDGTHWTHDTDMDRFTDPGYSGPGGFWRSDYPTSPAYRGKPVEE